MKNPLPHGNKIIAFLWGAAEAIFFFIVPDVFLSYLALDGLKKSLIACLYACLGAVLGGWIMYSLSYSYPEESLKFLDSIPAISPQLIEVAKNSSHENMFSGMLIGSFTGVPYKIFAAYAGISSFPVFLFLLFTIPVRLARFIIIALLSSTVSRIALKKQPYKIKLCFYMIIWIIFYIYYFYTMGW